MNPDMIETNRQVGPEHPHAKQAGSVQDFGCDTARELSLHYLLDCLRELHPSGSHTSYGSPRLVGAEAFRRFIPICTQSKQRFQTVFPKKRRLLAGEGLLNWFGRVRDWL